MAWAAL